MNEERRIINASPWISEDEILEFTGADFLHRQEILVRLVNRAYDKGWSDCDKQWTDHVLELPAAQA